MNPPVDSASSGGCSHQKTQAASSPYTPFRVMRLLYNILGACGFFRLVFRGHLNCVLYGYKRSPTEKHQMVIDEVNALEESRGGKAVGIQKREFSLFIPSLIKYSHISDYAKKIIEFRDLQKNKNINERKTERDKYRQNFAAVFLKIL